MAASFLDEIVLGRFVAGESPLHRMNTNLKFLLMTLVALCCFLWQSSASFFLAIVLVGCYSYYCGLPQLLFWRSLRPVNLLAILTIIAGATINHPQASPLNPNFSWDGMHTGGLYAARLILITLLTTLFLLTTTASESIKLGIRILGPLRLIGIEKKELSLLVHLAYRFVPLLRREIKELEQGSRARNLPPPKSLYGKIKEATGKLVFLLVGAIKRAETTALALEQRQILDSWQASHKSKNTGLGAWMAPVLLGFTLGISYFDGKLF